MGKIILAHGVIYPSFYTFTRHGEAWSDWISREIWENVKLMSISQPVLWIIPIFLWKITNFEENEIHFWLGHSFMIFCFCLFVWFFYTTKVTESGRVAALIWPAFQAFPSIEKETCFLSGSDGSRSVHAGGVRVSPDHIWSGLRSASVCKAAEWLACVGSPELGHWWIEGRGCFSSPGSHELRLLHSVLVCCGIPWGVTGNIRGRRGCFDGGGWVPDRRYGWRSGGQSAPVSQRVCVYCSSALLHQFLKLGAFILKPDLHLEKKERKKGKSKQSERQHLFLLSNLA